MTLTWHTALPKAHRMSQSRLDALCTDLAALAEVRTRPVHHMSMPGWEGRFWRRERTA